MDSPPDGPKARFNNEPVLKQPFGEQIHGVCFSPFEWSHELLLVVFHNKVLVAEVRTDVGDDAEPDVKVIGNLNHAVQCRRVAVSPASSLAVAPKLVQFATAGADNRVRVFRSDLAHDNTCHVLAGHADAINDLSYDCETNYLASASDDHTARVWDADTCLVTFCLRSPAVAVCWHQDDCAKLMVCERSGLIRCYNVQSQQPILSVDNGSLLSSAHWSPSDSQLLAALAHGHLKLWDLTRPRYVRYQSFCASLIVLFTLAADRQTCLSSTSRTAATSSSTRTEITLPSSALSPSVSKWCSPRPTR